MSPITNAQADKVISGAKRRAVELGVEASIAVQDDGGHPIAFSRMDGAFLGLIEIAEKGKSTQPL